MVLVYKELKVIEKMQKIQVRCRGRGGLVRVVVNEKLKLLWNCPKKIGGCQGGCERRIEVIVTMQKKEKKSGWRGSGFGGWGESGWI